MIESRTLSSLSDGRHPSAFQLNGITKPVSNPSAPSMVRRTSATCADGEPRASDSGGALFYFFSASPFLIPGNSNLKKGKEIHPDFD